MAEMTLDQQKAIALANARSRMAAAGVQSDQQSQSTASKIGGFLQNAQNVADYINPVGGVADWLGKSIADDISGAPKKDARDNTIGKIDAAMRGAADTASFGLADEASAAGNALFNPLLGTGYDGPSFSDRYSKDVAAQRATDRSDQENRWRERMTGQIAGALLQGGALAKNGLSITANAIDKAAALGKGVPWYKLGMTGAIDGGILGALNGFGSGEGTDARISKAAKGGALSAVVGGATPLVVSAAKTAINPIAAYINPAAAQDRVMANVLQKSQMTPEELASKLQAAQDDAQPMYTAADALGLPGQRIASTVARSPNDARKQIYDTILGRQMDQGRRVAADLTDAAGTPQTAQQYQDALRTARSEEAARNYLPVQQDITPINVTPAVAEANRRISPQADYLAGVRGDVPTDLASRRPIEAAESQIRDPIREAVRQARSYLASDNLTVTNVEKAFRAKTNIDQMIDDATNNGQGAQVEALTPIRDALDNALAATSRQYAAARDAYRTASQRVDAVDVGRTMERGRTRIADNLATFSGLPDDEARAAARIGYFDPKIAAAESTKGTMTNAARPFMSESMRQELPAFAAPDQGEMLMRRLGRENTMSETAQNALGGSKTLDNMADASDSGLDPGMLSALAQGRIKDAALSILTKGANAAKGLPPSVLERLGPAMMETDPQRALELFTKSAQNQSVSDRVRAGIVAALLSGNSSAIGRLAP